MAIDRGDVIDSIENTGNEGGGIAESLSELIQDLSDREKHIVLSELSEREIKHLSVIKTTGKNDEITEQFVKDYMTMKISKKRRGRKELVKIGEAFSTLFESEEKGRMDRLRGMVGL